MPFIYEELTKNDFNVAAQHGLQVLSSLSETLEQDRLDTPSLLKSLAKITGENSHYSPDSFDEKINEYANKLDCLFPTKEEQNNYLNFFIDEKKRLLEMRVDKNPLLGFHKEFRLLTEALSFNLKCALVIAGHEYVEPRKIRDAFQSITVYDQALESLTFLCRYLKSQNKIGLDTKFTINAVMNHQIIQQSSLGELFNYYSSDVHDRAFETEREGFIKELRERHPLGSLPSYCEVIKQIHSAKKVLSQKRELSEKQIKDISEVLNIHMPNEFRPEDYLPGLPQQEEIRLLWSSSKADIDGQVAFFTALYDAGRYAYDGKNISCFKGVTERISDQIRSYTASKSVQKSSDIIKSLNYFFCDSGNKSQLSELLSLSYKELSIKSSEKVCYSDQEVITAQEVIEHFLVKTLPNYIDPSLVNMIKRKIIISLERLFFELNFIGDLDDQDNPEDSNHFSKLEKFQLDNTVAHHNFWKKTYKRFKNEKDFIPYFSENALKQLFSELIYEDMGSILDIYERNPYQEISKTIKNVIESIKKEKDNIGDEIDHPIGKLYQRLSDTLLKSVQSGNLELIRTLVENGVNINDAFEPSRQTPLHVAVDHGHLELVGYLLTKGSRVDMRDSRGCTPLNLAVKTGNAEIVSLLLDKCTNNIEDAINSKDEYGMAPLDSAVRKRNLGMVRLLLAKGGKGGDVDHALHEAVLYGNDQIVRVLLDNGADVNSGEMPTRPLYCEIPTTPLYSVIEQRISVDEMNKIVSSLLEHGANVERRSLDLAVDRGCSEIVDMLTKKDPNIIEINSYPKLLREAIGSGNENIVRSLIDSYNSKVRESTTTATVINEELLLHLAINVNNISIIKFLIAKGAHVDVMPDSIIQSPLKLAIENGLKDIVKLLLDRGASIKNLENSGCVPLHTAIKNGSPEMVKLLLDRGADTEKLDSHGCVPLHIAIYERSPEIVKMLLDKKVDVNATTTPGLSTPLHVATVRGEDRIVHLLLEKNPNVNEKNTLGTTPLHYAICSCTSETVNALLHKGADPKLPDLQKRTPLHWAELLYGLEEKYYRERKKNRLKIVEILKFYKNYPELNSSNKDSHIERGKEILKNKKNPNEMDLIAASIRQDRWNNYLYRVTVPITKLLSSIKKLFSMLKLSRQSLLSFSSTPNSSANSPEGKKEQKSR